MIDDSPGTWKIAGVQMDSTLGDKLGNLRTIQAKLDEAAKAGARLIVFPELALTGYNHVSRDAAAELAETVPGPSTEAIAKHCALHDVWAVVGMIEKKDDKLYNVAVTIGPKGVANCFRKIHMPCMGCDRFLDPGDRPFEVFDIGGLRLGVHICFDASFPESARVMTLAGADLLVLPTNWADNAYRMATLVPPVRAFENSVYSMCVNRVGDEAGYHYIGHSSMCDTLGRHMTDVAHDREAIFYAEIDPEKAREKKFVSKPGEYEIDRVNWRRPEFYGPLAATSSKRERS